MRYKSYICIVVLLLSMAICNIAMATPQSIDLNFMDEDVRVVLHTLATIGNVDMVIDDSIKGNITIKLNNVTFESAMNVITSAKGLSYRKVGDSFIIEPADMGVTEVIKLQYIRAVDIKKTLGPVMDSLKLKTEIDDVSNSLLFTGTPTGCARIRTLLATLDAPQQQVMLEAKVVVIMKTDTKNLGVDWTWSGSTSDSSSGAIKYGVSNSSGVPYAANYTVSALVAKGNAKVLASPKVTTISGKDASILIGERIPVLTKSTSNGSTTTTIEYVDAGIKLIYTPTVTADGNITAKVRTEVSSATLVSDIDNYKITTREVETTVSMKDGETMVIGGLIGSDESKSKNSVPFLSNIPLVGNLFKSVNNSKTENEVIIFLTARVIK